MKILCTFPGKFGDILWALPTVRAISETYDVPVDFACCHSNQRFDRLLPLVQLQPYIDHAYTIEDWQPQQVGSAPFTPYKPESQPNYEAQYDLGYQAWPAHPLAQEIHLNAQTAFEDSNIHPLDLDRPWIDPPEPFAVPGDLAIGFTDEWFELKVGLTCCVLEHLSHLDPQLTYWIGYPATSRWDTERRFGRAEKPSDWVTAATQIARCHVFLGCCAALHVLACALGKPVILIEPSAARWNEIFYPYGKAGRVTLVLGNDGRPTFDARAVRQAIEQALALHV